MMTPANETKEPCKCKIAFKNENYMLENYGETLESLNALMNIRLAYEKKTISFKIDLLKRR